MVNRRGYVGVFLTHRKVFGLVSAIRAALAHLIYQFLAPAYETRDFDKRFGTDTSTFVRVSSGSIPEKWRNDAIAYEPTIEPVFRAIMRELAIHQSRFVFVDLGCGKGRTLLLAADYTFESILGIELSPITAGIAQKNIEKYNGLALPTQKCRNITVRCENAVDFLVPESDMVLFMYNPFVGAVFQDCIHHIHQAFIRNPGRAIHLVYLNPWICTEWLENSGLFQKINEVTVIPRQWSWSVWRPIRDSSHLNPA